MTFARTGWERSLQEDGDDQAKWETPYPQRPFFADWRGINKVPANSIILLRIQGSELQRISEPRSAGRVSLVKPMSDTMGTGRYSLEPNYLFDSVMTGIWAGTARSDRAGFEQSLSRP